MIKISFEYYQIKIILKKLKVKRFCGVYHSVIKKWVKSSNGWKVFKTASSSESFFFQVTWLKLKIHLTLFCYTEWSPERISESLSLCFV